MKFRLEVYRIDGGGSFAEGGTDDDLEGALRFLSEWRNFPDRHLLLGSNGPDGIPVRYGEIASARLAVEA